MTTSAISIGEVPLELELESLPETAPRLLRSLTAEEAVDVDADAEVGIALLGVAFVEVEVEVDAAAVVEVAVEDDEDDAVTETEEVARAALDGFALPATTG